MKSRHKAREAAFQFLYRMDPEKAPPEGAELARELDGHFEHFAVSPDLREFAALLVARTLHKREEIDALIEQHAANWKISRMALVDRNLLRMAIAELQTSPETPASVVIDEAIELSKQFGTADTGSFLNGILDAIRRASLEPKPTSD